MTVHEKERCLPSVAYRLPVIRHVIDWLVVYFLDHIPFLQAGIHKRAGGVDAGNDDA